MRSAVPTPERRRHGRLVRIATETAGVDAFAEEAPLLLDRCLEHGLIDARAYDAGLAYRRLWLAAGREAGVVARYRPWRGGGAQPPSDAMEAAARACRAAERAVGPTLLPAVQAVAIDERPADPRRLAEGLARLARWFGL